jgi:LPXTG-motif cell wall-anchored protein
MPYMLAPGARLEVGPGGRMYESMGACCAPCARGARCASLGALDKSGNVIGTSSLKSGALTTRLDPRLFATMPGASASGKFFSGSLGPTILIGGAVLAGAAFLLLRKRRRR